MRNGWNRIKTVQKRTWVNTYYYPLLTFHFSSDTNSTILEFNYMTFETRLPLKAKLNRFVIYERGSFDTFHLALQQFLSSLPIDTQDEISTRVQATV